MVAERRQIIRIQSQRTNNHQTPTTIELTNRVFGLGHQFVKGRCHHGLPAGCPGGGHARRWSSWGPSRSQRWLGRWTDARDVSGYHAKDQLGVVRGWAVLFEGRDQIQTPDASENPARAVRDGQLAAALLRHHQTAAVARKGVVLNNLVAVPSAGRKVDAVSGVGGLEKGNENNREENEARSTSKHHHGEEKWKNFHVLDTLTTECVRPSV